MTTTEGPITFWIEPAPSSVVDGRPVRRCYVHFDGPRPLLYGTFGWVRDCDLRDLPLATIVHSLRYHWHRWTLESDETIVSLLSVARDLLIDEGYLSH